MSEDIFEQNHLIISSVNYTTLCNTCCVKFDFLWELKEIMFLGIFQKAIVILFVFYSFPKMIIYSKRIKNSQ